MHVMDIVALVVAGLERRPTRRRLARERVVWEKQKLDEFEFRRPEDEKTAVRKGHENFVSLSRNVRGSRNQVATAARELVAINQTASRCDNIIWVEDNHCLVLAHK